MQHSHTKCTIVPHIQTNAFHTVFKMRYLTITVIDTCGCCIFAHFLTKFWITLFHRFHYALFHTVLARMMQCSANKPNSKMNAFKYCIICRSVFDICIFYLIFSVFVYYSVSALSLLGVRKGLAQTLFYLFISCL